MRRRNRSGWPLLAVLLLAVSCSGGTSSTSAAKGEGGGGDDAHPNIVVVITDDQTVEMMRALPTTRRLLGGAGTTFARASVALPLCCPARATLLTGQYPHTHGVRDNVAPAGGFSRLSWDDTIAVDLQEAGYRTAHVGRTLNDYTVDARPLVPPGWDEWYTPIEDRSRSFISRGSSLVANGEIRTLGGTTHLDDALAAISLELVDEMVDDELPFYLELGFVAPHTSRPGPNQDAGLPVPADRHQGEAEGLPLAHEFGSVEPGKPAWVAERQNRSEDQTGVYWRRALESLRAVDEAVDSLVSRLRRSGELSSTVIVFTSDNGITLGEHGLSIDKVIPYEPAVHIPLLVRGPGFAHEVVDVPVSHVDVAPTILRAAGIAVPGEMEGVALQDAVDEPDRAARWVLLVESTPFARPAPPFWQVRSGSLVLTRYDDGSAELSDLADDPDQHENRIDDPRYADDVAALDGFGRSLRTCRGPGCIVYDDQERP